MRLAVISDVHGNLDALEAVLADIAAAAVDMTLSLGDNIGYGAEPEAVLARLRAEGIPSVCGNHELAVIDPAVRQWFNPLARLSIEFTRSRLNDEAMAYLRTLPKSIHLGACWFVHGFPPDSPTVYLFQVDDGATRDALIATGCRVCFVGHTHDLELVTADAASVMREALSNCTLQLDGTKRYLASIGSVGQPRDGNPDAKYVIYHTDTGALKVRYVPFDREAAARKIIAAGLPKNHANRLL